VVGLFHEKQRYCLWRRPFSYMASGVLIRALLLFQPIAYLYPVLSRELCLIHGMVSGLDEIVQVAESVEQAGAILSAPE